eukprot:927126-Prymnesium_polylepis.4
MSVSFDAAEANKRVEALIVLGGAGDSGLILLQLVCHGLVYAKLLLHALVQLANGLEDLLAHARLVVQLILAELAADGGLSGRLQRLGEEAPVVSVRWGKLRERESESVRERERLETERQQGAPRLRPALLEQHSEYALGRLVPAHRLRVAPAVAFAQLERVNEVAQKVEERRTLLELPCLLDRDDVTDERLGVTAHSGLVESLDEFTYACRPAQVVLAEEPDRVLELLHLACQRAHKLEPASLREQIEAHSSCVAVRPSVGNGALAEELTERVVLGQTTAGIAHTIRKRLALSVQAQTCTPHRPQCTVDGSHHGILALTT